MFRIIAISILTVISFYFYKNFIHPLKIKKEIKWGLFILVLVLNNQLVYLPTYVPDEVARITVFFSTSIILAVFMSFFYDIFNLVLGFFKLKLGKRRGVILITSMILSIYGMYEALKVPEVKNISLEFENLPRDLKGKKIGVIADLHTGRFFRRNWVDSNVENTLKEKPDIIVLVGDTVDARLKEIKEDVLPLKKLEAPLGVYLIHGNHEYINNQPEWNGHLKSFKNLRVLNNENENIYIGNSTLSIIGITDEMANYFNLEHPNGKKAMKGIKEKDENTFYLLLSHRPYTKEYEVIKPDLQISGHTHGGTVSVLKRLVAKGNGGYVGGEYTTNIGKIFVSNGLGIWDGFPVRLGVKSELVIITLK